MPQALKSILPLVAHLPFSHCGIYVRVRSRLRFCWIVSLRFSRSCDGCGGAPPDTSEEDRQASSLESYSHLGIARIRIRRTIETESGRTNQNGGCASDSVLRKNCGNSGSRHVLSQGL